MFPIDEPTIVFVVITVTLLDKYFARSVVMLIVAIQFCLIFRFVLQAVILRCDSIRFL